MTDIAGGTAGGTATVTDGDVDLVLGLYRDWERGDIDAAVSVLHRDVVWIEPDEFPQGGRMEGREAVAQYLKGLRDGMAELDSHRSATPHDGDVVITHRIRGTLHDGTAIDLTVAEVYTVRNNEIVHMLAHADPDAPFAA